MANLIPQIAHMLGVALGEAFKIKGEDELMTYSFTDDGLRVTYGSDIELSQISTNSAFIALLNGKDEIVKLPWRPRNGEQFWTFANICYSGFNKWECCIHSWHGEVKDFARYKCGWVFRTREEAETALPAVAEEMGVQYNL